MKTAAEMRDIIQETELRLRQAKLEKLHGASDHVYALASVKHSSMLVLMEKLGIDPLEV